MIIKLSDYVRENAKTFKFGSMSGGVYGSNISYSYGSFCDGKRRGFSYAPQIATTTRELTYHALALFICKEKKALYCSSLACINL